MEQTYYSIRTIKAKSYEEALRKLEVEEFDEQDAMCDRVFTAKELENELARQKPIIQWVVKVTNPESLKKNKNSINKDGYLQFANKIVCYTRGTAIKKARLFDGKIEKLTTKFNKRKHIII